MSRADGPRTPYSWLRARGQAWDAFVDTYQDDAVFGLSFVSPHARSLPDTDIGSLCSRRDMPLVAGPIHQVEVVFDTLVAGGAGPGLVTEVLLHGVDRSTLLIAAEAYSLDPPPARPACSTRLLDPPRRWDARSR